MPETFTFEEALGQPMEQPRVEGRGSSGTATATAPDTFTFEEAADPSKTFSFEEADRDRAIPFYDKSSPEPQPPADQLFLAPKTIQSIRQGVNPVSRPEGNEPAYQGLVQAFNEPHVKLLRSFSEDQKKLIDEEGPTWLKQFAGAHESIANSVNWFTSTAGLATLGLGSAPKVVQKAVALAFAIDMASHLPETGAAIGEELAKPPGERDERKLAQLSTDALSTMAFATTAAKHGLLPTRQAPPPGSPRPDGLVPQASVLQKVLSALGPVKPGEKAAFDPVAAAEERNQARVAMGREPVPVTVPPEVPGDKPVLFPGVVALPQTGQGQSQPVPDLLAQTTAQIEAARLQNQAEVQAFERQKAAEGRGLPPTVVEGGVPGRPDLNQGFAALAPPAVAPPVPEPPATLAAQIEWLRNGKRDAVLFTPGEALPEGATLADFSSVETPHGTILFNPQRISGTAILDAVAQNRLGDVLGYGISAKPAPEQAAGVVVVRAPDGTEKQAVVTDQANAPAVVQAAANVADHGDKIAVEMPEQVVQGRTAGVSGGTPNTATGTVALPGKEGAGAVPSGPPVFARDAAASAIERLRAKAAQRNAPVAPQRVAMVQTPEEIAANKAWFEEQRARQAEELRRRSQPSTPNAQPAWTPPRAEPVVPISGEETSDLYTIRDAVRENGGLTGPDLDAALKAMRAGQKPAAVVQEWAGGGEHDDLANILEQIAAVRDEGNSAEYRRLRQAYQKTFVPGRPKVELTLQGIQKAQESGVVPTGGVPQDAGELISRAWADASKPARIDREATAAAQAEADHQAFVQSLQVRGKQIFSGTQPLGEIHTDRTGRRMLVPTPEAEALSPEFQAEVLNKAGIETEHGMDAGEPVRDMTPGELDEPTIRAALDEMAGLIYRKSYAELGDIQRYTIRTAVEDEQIQGREQRDRASGRQPGDQGERPRAKLPPERLAEQPTSASGLPEQYEAWLSQRSNWERRIRNGRLAIQTAPRNADGRIRWNKLQTSQLSAIWDGERADLERREGLSSILNASWTRYSKSAERESSARQLEVLATQEKAKGHIPAVFPESQWSFRRSVPGFGETEHGMDAGDLGLDAGAGIPNFDPSLLRDLTQVAGNVIESGAADFPSFARAMGQALDGQFAEYYHAAYNQVREFTEAAHLKARMTPREETELYDAQGNRIATPAGPAGPGLESQLSGAVRGGGSRPRRPGLRVVDEGDLPAARPIVRSGEYTGPAGLGIDETQRSAANLALTALEDGKPAFLLGDGTGVGKTGTELVVAAQTALRTKLPSLIVTSSKEVIENRFKQDQIRFGIPSQGIEFATYNDLSRGTVPSKKFGLVLYDEAHNLKNADSTRTWNTRLIDARHKVFATATPMDSPPHAAYFLAQLTGKTEAEIARRLGYHYEEKIINGEIRQRAVLDKDMTWARVIDNIKAERTLAVRNGQLIRREYPFFGEVNWRNAEPLNIDQAQDHQAMLEYWDERIAATRMPEARRNLAGQKSNEISRWTEAQKAPAVLRALLKDLDRGRRVIVFGEGVNETAIKGLEGKVVPGILGYLARELDQRGIKYAKIFGPDSDKKAAANRDFQSDHYKVALATPKSGGTGLDMDDIVGDRPRTVHLATLNWAGDTFDQIQGRVSRRNTASPSEFYVWRQPESFGDQRKQIVADRKLRTLRSIQSGEDLDTGQFETSAEHGMEEVIHEMAAATPASIAPAPLVASSEPSPSAFVKELEHFRSVTAPQTAGPPARFAANLLRELGAKMANELARADVTLKPFRRDFDRSPLPKDWQYDPSAPLPRNLAFIDAYEGGDVQTLGPIEAQAAAEFARQNQQWLDRIHALGTGALQHAIENYFPHLWDNPKRARQVIAEALAKRPLEGSKSFLKQRTYQLFREGLEAGLKPVHDNPVDLWMLKKREVERYILARSFINEMKAAGLMKFNYVFSRVPEGWRAVKDPAFTQYGPPSVTIKEAFDAGMRAKTLEVLEHLGVPHSRLVKIGGKRWGFERDVPGVPGTERIVTKFGGPDFVIWHELGHALDNRYRDLRDTMTATPAMEQELRRLADLRFEGENISEGRKRYIRSMPEKMAVTLQAYLHAPDRMAQVAPTVKAAFEGFLRAHPELSEINDIRPSLRLGVGEAEMPVSGLIKLGDWILPEAATQVVDNYLSPGLNPRLWYRTLRESSNLLNGVQLGLSAFHLGFTSLDAATSRLALGLEDAVRGDLGRAVRTIASVPVSPFTNIAQGARLRRAVLSPAYAATHPELQPLVHALEAAGGRVGQDRFWRTEFTRRMQRAIREGTATGYLRGALQAPFALWEQSMRPIMEYVVPRQKLGVFADMAKRELLRLGPTSDAATTREAMRKAWDSVDNRMGQLVYDNLFYNRAVKDLALLTFRAYGWQLGKYREGLGAGVDVAKAARALARGEKPEFSHRMAYAMALPIMVGTLGGVVNYLFTGQQPQEKDWFMPRTGEQDQNGNEVRLNFPSYMKDVLAYAKHPVTSFGHSLNPLLSAMADVLGNHDFYDVRIRNPDDPLWQQGSDLAAFAAKQFTPFSVSGLMKLRDDAAPVQKQIMPFFGLTVAPSRMTMTPAQALAAEITQGSMPREPRTPEQFDRAKLIKQAVQQLKNGNAPAADELLRGGIERRLLNAGSAQVIIDRLRYSPLQFQVHHMTPDAAMRVWRVANDAERALLKPIIVSKVGGSRTLAPETAALYLQELMK